MGSARKSQPWKGNRGSRAAPQFLRLHLVVFLTACVNCPIQALRDNGVRHSVVH
jgi:hypothetical protein